MDYFDDEKNVEQYEAMTAGYQDPGLMDALARHVSAGSRVLELGMGPGRDLDLLSARFQATGSDRSPVFLDRYRARHPDADLLLLDAVALDTDRRFDAIFSNKVLQHLTRDQVTTSLARQRAVLTDGGILLHTLWHGDKVEHHHGLRFVYYTPDTFARLVPPGLEVLESTIYREEQDHDSLFVVLRKSTA